jgi:ABC-2 type transport system ATP-binding protein
MTTTRSREAAVAVRDLLKRYGDRTAVAGVSFEIEHGETFALLGPNGAGKSTTIEILEGYRRRSGGEARVLGVDPGTGGVDWKARLGIVLQSSAEAGSLPVREQLAHFASFYPHPRDVDATLEAVGLTDASRMRVRALSGSDDASTWRSGSSAAPSCCSSTSRPPGSTGRPAAGSGTSSGR